MAPHGQFKLSEKGHEDIFSEPPISAARHAHLFEDVTSMHVTFSFFLTWVIL